MAKLNFFTEYNAFWNPEFEEAFYEATKVVTRLQIGILKPVPKLINFYQDLEHLNYLQILVYISRILHLPRLPLNIDLGPVSILDDKPVN